MCVFLFRQVLLKPCSMWYDNYDKFWYSSMPTMKNSPFRSCLWTGKAVHAYPYDDLTMEVVMKADGTILPAWPETIHDLLSFSDGIWEDIEEASAMGSLLLDDSLVEKFNVCTVPLKPLVNQHLHPNHHKKLKEARNKVSDLLTMEISDHNITSNCGLHCLIQEFCDEWLRPAKRNSRYWMVFFGVNIYKRMLKVSVLMF